MHVAYNDTNGKRMTPYVCQDVFKWKYMSSTEVERSKEK